MEDVNAKEINENGNDFYITISEKEWLKILRSYIKMSEELNDEDTLNYLKQLLNTYEELKKRNYVLEFYYSPTTGKLKLFARTREEYEIYRKKLFELYGII